MLSISLTTDGPHSPDYTRQLGDALAETVRCLNYATLGDAPGLEYPGDVYSLLGALYTASGRLPQLFDQLGAFLKAQADAGRLADNSGRGPATAALDAIVGLNGARRGAADLTGVLQAVQYAISGLYVKDEADD